MARDDHKISIMDSNINEELDYKISSGKDRYKPIKYTKHASINLSPIRENKKAKSHFPNLIRTSQ